MKDLIPCPYCFNGSTDPIVCSVCGQKIDDAVEDEDCIFKVPSLGVLTINSQGVTPELRKMLLKVISDHVAAVDEYQDMKSIKYQLSTLTETNELSFDLYDHIADSIIEKIRSNNSFKNIVIGFQEIKN